MTSNFQMTPLLDDDYCWAYQISPQQESCLNLLSYVVEVPVQATSAIVTILD